MRKYGEGDIEKRGDPRGIRGEGGGGLRTIVKLQGEKKNLALLSQN